MCAKVATVPTISKIVYTTYRIVLQCIGRLEGGIPKDPAVIKKWLETKGVSLADLYQESAVQSLQNGEQPDTAELEQKAWCGFMSHPEKGIYIEARQIGAAFKEAANVLRPIVSVTAFKARVAERLWVSSTDPFTHECIWLTDSEGNHVLTPTGSYERPVHVMTRMGPISALKRTDYVDQPRLEFQVEVLDDGLLTEEMLQALLNYMGRNGIGANRSQGAGQFKVVGLEKVETE